jgi:pyruvate/2-oxoglutarate dehydrogenase complex dihydrolipoamide acyltransferase (E2) component
MKRCSLCDFIYEDEQSLCDMDGFELVADSGLLTRLENTALVPAELPQPKSSWGRRLAFPTVATVILGAVLFLVYYVPTHRTVRQSNYSPAQVTTGSQPGQTLDPAATDSPQSSPSPESENPNAQAHSNTSRSETLAPSASPSPAAKRAEKKHKIATAQPVGANQKNRFKHQEHPDEKKDSKVASFLKKTGRVLKKPFEF